MSKTNYLFDIIAINQMIEDFDLDTKLMNNGSDFFKICSFNCEKQYAHYREQFNNTKCIDGITIKYKDKDNDNRSIDIVDFILDLFYNNEYLSEYQMLYVIKCLNDKLTNILFECLDVITNNNNMIETGVINDIIENEIY